VRDIPRRPAAVDPLVEAIESTEGGKLLVVSSDDGSTLAEYALQSPPVFDGMVAAGGRLYFSNKQGEVVCMSPVDEPEPGS
jgi:hypothetical protein